RLEDLRRRNVYFVGPGGSGKSNQARGLAAILDDREIYEMDNRIEEYEQRRIPDIFELFGEPYFRERETEVLRESARGRWIVSTGGGIVCREENRVIMRASGFIIYLNVPFEVTFARAMKQQAEDGVIRPLMQVRGNAERTYKERLPLYLDVADLVIEVDGKLSKAEVTGRVLETIESL